MRLSRRCGLIGTLLCCATAFSAPPVHARSIPYEAVTDTAVRTCDGLQWQGARSKARDCYRGLLTRESAMVRAEASWALGDFKAANEYFRAALAERPQDALVRVRWGELYVDTHQDQDALDLFKEALEREPKNAFAKVGLATVLTDEYAAQAAQGLNEVLNDRESPAGARLRALLLLGRSELEDSDAASATKHLDAATALAAQAKLPDLEVLALRAALLNMSGNSDEAVVAQALREDPAYGDIYAVPAQFYVFTRRQREAIDLYQKAVSIQPDLWSAQVGLASCLLRENRITEAREHLEAAYKGDPYDPVTVNTLRLLDSLNQFDVLVYPQSAIRAGQSDERPALILRLNKKESAVLAPYAKHLAEQAMATYTTRYRFQLKEPVVVEVYPDHEDFAVRTAGMPGIGLLGVTFGYVIAMDSPSSRAVNEFHWGTTLWHEMAHVFTLESTDHRVPRWLSEGLSVFEEWRTGPIKGMEIPTYVYAPLAQNKALPVTQLDQGFIRPAYPEQVQVSYMQAGLICDYIDRTYGFDKLLNLLQQYTHTNDTGTAIRDALGVSPEEFDTQFRSDLQQQFGNLFKNLDAWRESRADAYAALEKQDWNAANAAAARALAIEPQDVEEQSPYLALARSDQALHRTDDERDALEDYARRGGHDPQALKELARLLDAAHRRADAVAVLQSVNYVAPFDYDLHGQLGDWLLALNRNSEALAEYQAALALNPPDQAAAHYRLAEAQYALHSNAEARRQVLAALEAAPNYKPAQHLLLQLSGAAGDSSNQPQETKQ